MAGLSLGVAPPTGAGPGRPLEPSLHGPPALSPSVAAANMSAGADAAEDWAPCWLAERLSRDAVLGEADVTWIGAMAISETASELAPLHSDLYDGTAGVALFLGYLGRQDLSAQVRLHLLRALGMIASASSIANSDQRTTAFHASSPRRTNGPSGSFEINSGRIM